MGVVYNENVHKLNVCLVTIHSVNVNSKLFTRGKCSKI